MELIEVATIAFPDLASGDEAVVVIRAAKGQVSLCLSLANGGDVEVLLSSEHCENLITALQRAALIVQRED